MTARRPQIDTALRDHDRLARLIIEAGFSAGELSTIADTSAGINFREIARGYPTWTEQVAGLLRAAELRNVYEDLITGLIQARADNATIQAAIMGNDMQQQADQQVINFRLIRLEEKIDRMDERIQNMDRRLAASEMTRETTRGETARTSSIDRFAVLILALVMAGMFLFNAFGGMAR